MSRYGFLRSRRWVGLALVIVVAATACVFLGMWQWSRHESRSAANDLVNTNYDEPTEPMSELVEGSAPADLVWRSVEIDGSYVGEQVLVRNRPVDGTAAARVLALLRVDDDGGERLVVVDRGWLPLGEDDVVPPAYPDGEVSVVGRLRQSEPVDSRTAPAGQVYAIEPATVAQVAGVEGGPEPFDGYLLATTEDGVPVEGLSAFPRPETTPGSHLSYAFQWWVFAVGFLVGYVVLARREAADLAAGQAGEPARAERPTRRPTDADEEDALIDAQLHEA